MGSSGDGWGRGLRRIREAWASLLVRAVLLVVLASLPAFAFILYSAGQQRRQAVASTRESTDRFAQLAAADHEQLIEQTQHLLGVLTQVPDVVDGDPARCQAFLARLADQHAPRYTGLAVAEPDGTLSCVSLPATSPVNVADRLYFRRAMQTRAFAVGEYMIGRVSGEPALAMALPVLDATGEVRRVITAVLSLDWLRQFLAGIDAPAGAVLTLTDLGGRVLARYPAESAHVGTRFTEAPLVRAMRAAPRGGLVELEGTDGVERLYAFRPLRGAGPDGNVYLSVAMSKEVAFGAIDRALRRTLLQFGMVTGLMLLAAWWGGYLLFTRRVQALLRATARIEAGDLSARTGLAAGRGELDELAHAFDHMAERLEQQTAALRSRAETEGFLARTSSALGASLGSRDTARAVAELAVPTLADWCVLDLIDENGRLRRVACAHREVEKRALLRRLPSACPPQPNPDGEGAAEPAESARQIRIPEEAALAEVAGRPRCVALLRHLGVRALLLVPLVARGQRLGRMVAGRAEPRGGWTDEETATAVAFAQRAALSVDTARLYERAVEANRAKSAFLAVVSHELRTPLNAIMGYADLMDAGIPVPLPDPQLRHVERIRVSTRHLTELIEQVLSFSRLEAGRDEVSPQPTDLAGLVREVAALVEPLCGEKRLDLRVVAPEEPVPAETDPGKVRQIVLNLLSNAVKFTDRGKVELRMRAERGRVRITVEDTGIGIAGDDLAKIFEPFTQLEQGPRRRGGTGLGLSVSRHLAHLLGGELRVESRLGKGSRFELVLLRRLQAPRDVVHLAQAPPGRAAGPLEVP